MKKRILILLAFLGILTLSACSPTNKYDIITTMIPQYSLAKEIAGDKLSVHLITKPGVDVHSSELSSKDVIKINNSKLLLYTSDIIDTQIARLTIKGPIVVDLSSHILSEHEDNHIDEHEHDHDHDHASIHYWTSYHNLEHMANVIFENIIKIDPDNKPYYEENLNIVLNKLTELETELIKIVSLSSTKEIFYAGHNAMDALANEIGLTITALVDDIKPNADITSPQIQNLINKIKENNAKYLFVPELESLKVVETISRALKNENIELEILELHGLHNISKKEFESGISIFDILKQNNINLEKGLKND